MNNVIAHRESSFELMRILAQWMIVVYHIMTYIVTISDVPFFTAVWLPLHIGVPVFVLISGYWGIRVSCKGLFRLIGQLFVYTVPLLLFNYYLHLGGGSKELIKSMLFISNSPYWFMRTYLCLYLFSPVVNSYLRDIDMRSRIYLLLSLAFICTYLGTASACDSALNDGKNLANFVFLYVVGNTLHHYEDEWKKWSTQRVLWSYLLLNFTLVVLYTCFKNSVVGTVIFRLSFPYCSPILLINALLFTVLVAKHSFKSKLVNYAGSSALAIYLIHCSPVILSDIIEPVSQYLKALISDDYLFVLGVILFALVVSMICIVIDKVLSPFWKCFLKWGTIADSKIGKLGNK